MVQIRESEESDHVGKKIISFERKQDVVWSVRRDPVCAFWLIGQRDTGVYHSCDHYTGQSGSVGKTERVIIKYRVLKSARYF